MGRNRPDPCGKTGPSSHSRGAGLCTALAIVLTRGKRASTSPDAPLLSTANVLLVAAAFYHSSSGGLIRRTANQLKYSCRTAERTPGPGTVVTGVCICSWLSLGVRPYPGGLENNSKYSPFFFQKNYCRKKPELKVACTFSCTL